MTEPDMEADTLAVKEGGETPFLMEPLLLRSDSVQRVHLTDLALSLVQKSAGFRRSIPGSIGRPAADRRR